MYYHIIMTEKCNSQCRYCYEKSLKEFDNDLNKKFEFDFSAPCDLNVDISKLKKFIEEDKQAVIIFYGGEPLLKTEAIQEIMDNINCRFMIQTNGKLLDKLGFGYINRLDKIIISIDGNKQTTDFNRGKGTYDLVLKNINFIRKNGFKGEIIARMTLSFSDGFLGMKNNVLHLFKLGFNSVHWQLDAGFFKFDFDKEKFTDFSKKYNLDVEELIHWWVNEMQTGKVYKIYPFVGIMESLLKKEKTKLRCGAGYEGYAITTNGEIVACPIMNCIKNFRAGNLNNSFKDLKKFEISGRCLNCEYFNLCGGRCLYWNKTQLWSDKGNELICDNTKFLIDCLKNKEGIIKKLIENKKIKLQDFEYEKYFGPEIIP